MWESLLVKYLPYWITYSYSISDSLNELNLKSLLYCYGETGRCDFTTLKKPNKPGFWMDILVSKANGGTFLHASCNRSGVFFCYALSAVKYFQMWGSPGS